MCACANPTNWLILTLHFKRFIHVQSGLFHQMFPLWLIPCMLITGPSQTNFYWVKCSFHDHKHFSPFCPWYDWCAKAPQDCPPQIESRETTDFHHNLSLHPSCQFCFHWCTEHPPILMLTRTGNVIPAANHAQDCSADYFMQEAFHYSWLNPNHPPATTS